MPPITGGVKDIVRYARLGLFQAHTEDLRLKWIILGETLKVGLQEVLFQAFTRSPDSDSTAACPRTQSASPWSGGWARPSLSPPAPPHHPRGPITFTEASLIHDHFGWQVDAVIEGSRVSAEPSSIISLVNDTPQIIRRGAGDVGLFE